MLASPPSIDGNLCPSIFTGQLSMTKAVNQGCSVRKTSPIFRLCASIDATQGNQTGTSQCPKSNDNNFANMVGVDLAMGEQKQSCASVVNPLLPAKEIESVIAPSENAKEKVGVLLLNLGGPETLDDVQPFLYNLFADPDIIRLPRLLKILQKPLAQFISVVRAPKSKAGYAAIGGGSPLRKITEEQAKSLMDALQKKNFPAKVYIGMRYWHPFTEEAIQEIKRDQITKLVVLPLYPQFSISTSGSSLRLLEEIFRKDNYLANMQHIVIPSWYQREGYIKAMSTLINKELNTFKNPNEVVIFFSAHGVPRNYVEEAGDPYKDEMEKCVRLIMTELRQRGVQNEYALAYQSRVGPAEWLKPYTDDTIKALGQRGVKSLVAVPISFVSEHIETLEEIDVEYKELAIESGITNWGRVPALGCEETFITDLADAVIEVASQVGPPAAPKAWTISTTLQDYFLPYGGRAWMEWLPRGG